MKISYNWLKQYVDPVPVPAKVSQLLTDCGLEVEGTSIFQSVKGGLEGAINDVVFARCGWNGFSLSVGTGIKIKPSKIFSLKFLC